MCVRVDPSSYNESNTEDYGLVCSCGGLQGSLICLIRFKGNHDSGKR